MGKEIEHKYLVSSSTYKEKAKKSIHIFQGYLSKNPERVVRIRISNDEGKITIKGRTIGDTRLEYEYPIPLNDAKELLQLCEGKIIEKIRWIVDYEGLTWEVDEFIQPECPTVAEVELPRSMHGYALPPFVGEEVTGNERYYNSNLC